MNNAPATPTTVDWIALILLGLVWGASFLGVAIALEGYGPLAVAAGRIGLAAVALWGVARALGDGLPGLRSPEGRRVWAFATAMGVFSNAVPFFLLSWGMQHVTSGFAGITMAAVPIFVLVLAHFFLPGETLNWRRLAAFALGIAGVALLIGPDAFASGGSDAEGLARLACLLATACYAVGSIFTRLCPPVSLVSLSAAALIMAAAMIVPAALLIEGLPDSLPSARATLALVYLGLGPTALATLLLVRVIRGAGPGFLTQVNYHVPVWSVIFGVTILAEPLPPQFLVALGLIMAGLFVGRAKAWRRRP
jgi:drug/metabolite transporter (DMT)-like permease